MKNVAIPGSDFGDDISDPEEEEKEETKLKKTEQELQKISSGIGKGYERQLQYSSRFTE